MKQHSLSMIKKVEHMQLQIIGATGEIPDKELFIENAMNYAAKNHFILQVFNADLIYGKTHLESAVAHASRAFQQNTNTTHTLAMEILLYASGERQLQIALPQMGIHKGPGHVAIVLYSEENIQIEEPMIQELLNLLQLKRNDTVLKGNEKTLQLFGISEKEQQTVTQHKYQNLILEKVALVDIIK